MKSRCVVFLVCVLMVLVTFGNASASSYATWSDMADAMSEKLEESYQAYFHNNPQLAKELVDDVYYGFYEKLGFERATMSYISGTRGNLVEFQYSVVKGKISGGATNKEVRTEMDKLIKWLKEDAAHLDGKETSKVSMFIASLVIILREGLEAILVIAAIIAYLVRTGHTTQVRNVYISAGVAVLASAVMAYVLTKVLSISGASQEILEGAAMLLAVVVLYFVSNWMVSKSEAEAWKGYIEGKVQGAITKGSAFALSAAAFLAVFREGAETILFYQALLADADETKGMVWLGFIVGCVLLIFVFAIIRFGTMKLPLKPFFIGTSVLMYIMCIAFAGGGVKEFQEGNLVGVTPVPLVKAVPILGIYPTVQTLLPQVILLILAVVSFIYYRKKSKGFKSGSGVSAA